MPVLSQIPVITYTANGSVTVFAYPFQILNAADLKVFVNDIETTSGFTISGIGSSSGGNVTFTIAPLATYPIRLARVTSVTRTTDYVEGGAVPADTLDTDFDRTVMMVQELNTFSLMETGDRTFDAESKRIKNVATPINGNDAPNKTYVDNVLPAMVTTATTKASAASASAAAALTSETNALASKNAAATSASNAAGSAATAVLAANSTLSPWVLNGSGVTYTSGNVEFGPSRFIRGDFSNATLTTRSLFQTATTNSSTSVGIVPNGTATSSSVDIFNASTPTNSAVAQLAVNATDVRVSSTVAGSGTALPLKFYAGGAERLRIDTSGLVTVAGDASITGNLNIGGTTSAYFKVQAVQSASAGTGTYSTFKTATGTPVGANNYVLNHYEATATTFGAGSNVTKQVGFLAGTSLSSATTNYGVWSELPVNGTNNFNIYAPGTAPSYFAGSLMIGSALATPHKLHLSGSARFYDAGTEVIISNYFSVPAIATNVVGSAIQFGNSSSNNNLGLKINGYNRVQKRTINPNKQAEVETSFHSKSTYLWTARAGTAGWDSLGSGAALAVGTVTARSLAATNVGTRAKRVAFISAATAGSLAGHYDPTPQFSIGDGTMVCPAGFKYTCRFVIPTVLATQRMFVGLSSTVVAPTNVDPSTLLNSVGIGMISADQTQLHLIIGGTTAQLPIATGIPIVAGHLYDVVMESSEIDNQNLLFVVRDLTTSAMFRYAYVGDVYGVAIPATSVLMAHRAWVCNVTTALATAIDVCHVAIDSGYTDDTLF